MAKKAKSLLELPVEFGGYGGSGKTARLAINISRANLSPSAADKNLCGRRIRGRLEAKPNSNGDDPDQGRMFDDEVELAATFDIKGVGMKPTCFTASLTFAESDVKGGKLEQFAGRQGTLYIEEVNDAPEEKDGAEE